MNDILQFLGTFASIFSIPLAIILYFKTSDARQNKIRLEIIRSLSYRIGEGKKLDKIEVSAVFNSKVREHNIKKPFFSEITILEDILADVISNPFLISDQKTSIIKNVGDTLETYNAQNNKVNQKDGTSSQIKHIIHELNEYEPKSKRSTVKNAFITITTVLSFVFTVATFVVGENFAEIFSNVQFPTEIFISFVVTLLSAVITVIVEIIFKKIKKK